MVGVLKTIFLVLSRFSHSLHSDEKVINGNVNLKIGFRNRFSEAIFICADCTAR